MRGITYVQAFQYWVKMFAIALPAMPAADPPRRPARAGRAVRQRAPARAGRRPDGRARRAADADVPRGHAPRRRATAPRAAGEESSCRPARCAAGGRGGAGGRGHRRADRRRVVAPGQRDRAAARRCSSTRCCWRRSWARWACRTSSSASTPTRTARPRGARPCACSACSALFYLFPAVYGLLGRAFTPELYADRRDRLGRAARAGGGLAGAGRRRARRDRRRRARSRPSCRRRRACWSSIAGTVSHDVWPARRSDRGAGALPRRRAGGMLAPALLALARARASTSRCSSAGRSRSRRARSARCSCSASGGRG